MRQIRLTMGTVALAAVVLALPASADMGPGNGPPSGRGNKNPTCVVGCVQTAKACRQAARVQLRLCTTSNCSDELATVRQACEADESSPACQSALQALQACVHSCVNPFTSTQSACRSDAQQCGSQCPNRQPPPEPGSKDPACVGTCATALGTCLGTVRDAAQSCRSDCGPKIDAAQAACVGARRSQACQDARQAVYECLAPCDDGLRTATNTCLSTAGSCVNACPPANPGPTPTASPSTGG